MLSFPASSRIALLQYFISSNRARELFFHLQHRSGASPFAIASSAQVNGCPVLQSMKRLRLLRVTKGQAGVTKGMTEEGVIGGVGGSGTVLVL